MKIDLKTIIGQLPENLSSMDISLFIEEQGILGETELIPALVIEGKTSAGEYFSREIETTTCLENITGAYFFGAEERTKKLAEEVKKYYCSKGIAVNIR